MNANTGTEPTITPEPSKHCRIINPLPGTSGYIRRRSARRSVRSGRASWVNLQGGRIGVESDAIELLEQAAVDHEQHLADAWLWAQKLSGSNYDGVTRPMKLNEIAGLPMRSGDPTSPPVPRA